MVSANQLRTTRRVCLRQGLAAFATAAAQKRTDKGDDDDKRGKDRRYNRPEQRPAQQLRTTLEARQVCLENDLEESAFAMPAINCDLSITRLILETNTEMNAATAPRRNAGAATLAMMRPSYSTEGVIRRRSFATSMFSTNDLVDPCELYGSRSTFAAMSGARLTR